MKKNFDLMIERSAYVSLFEVMDRITEIATFNECQIHTDLSTASFSISSDDSGLFDLLLMNICNWGYIVNCNLSNKNRVLTCVLRSLNNDDLTYITNAMDIDCDEFCLTTGVHICQYGNRYKITIEGSFHSGADFDLFIEELKRKGAEFINAAYHYDNCDDIDFVTFRV